MKDRIWTAFSTSSLKDGKSRTLARLQLDCLNQVITALKDHMTTGKMAEAQLPALQGLLKKFSRK